MTTSLRQRLDELASAFASEVLDAIRGAPLQELVGAHSAGLRVARRSVTVDGPSAPVAARGRGGRLPRRSADDIEQVVEQIVGLLRQTPKGLRAEQIREKLGLEAKELPRPLAEALDSGRLAKSGQKRATTYFAKNAQKSSSGRSARGAAAGARRGRANAKRTRAPKSVGQPAEGSAAESETQS